MLNELITNSLKHGFPEGRQGEIRIEVRSVKGQIEIIMSDNGVGMPHAADKDRSMGHMLVAGLVENQLEGTWRLSSSEAGVTHTIRFKRP